MKAPVVTGESAVTALGRTLAETRAALAAGRSAIAPVEEDGAPRAADRSPAARIGAFTTEPELPKSKARRLDLGSQYAVVAVKQALADAGYTLAGREERTGILLGTGSAGAGAGIVARVIVGVLAGFGGTFDFRLFFEILLVGHIPPIL